MNRKRSRKEMRRSTPPRRVTALASAKINVGLSVGARRPDGYHDVCGLVQTVSLTDRLEVSLDPVRDAVEVGDGVHLSVPADRELEIADNLVVVAAAALADGRPHAPVWIRVDKAIPVAAGLGGGSADAAAALVALNVVWTLGADAEKLLEVAAGVSSDVPAIVSGGLVHIGGRGERVRGIGAATDGAFVLGISNERISAATAYEAFDRLEAGPSAGLHHNDLEAAALDIVPDLSSRMSKLRDAGADPVFVSGSGPTVVGVASSSEQAAEIASRAHGAFARIEVVTPTPWGVRVRIGGEDPLIN